MFQLTAVFNKDCLNDVLQDLYAEEIEGVTISDVVGKGGLGFVEKNGNIGLDQNIRLDIVLSNETYKEKAKEVIRSNTQGVELGSGKMWVTPVLEVERIRTGEKDAQALTKSNRNSSKHIKENYFNAIDTPSS